MLPEKVQKRANQFVKPVEDEHTEYLPDIPKPKARYHLLNSDFKDHLSLDQLWKLASVGFTENDISDFLGFNRKSFKKFLSKNPEYELTFKQAKLEITGKVSKKVIEAAMNGDMRAATFYLQAQGGSGWSTKQSVEHSVKEVSQDDINREKEALMGKLFKMSQQELIADGIIDAEFTEVKDEDDKNE